MFAILLPIPTLEIFLFQEDSIWVNISIVGYVLPVYSDCLWPLRLQYDGAKGVRNP